MEFFAVLSVGTIQTINLLYFNIHDASLYSSLYCIHCRFHIFFRIDQMSNNLFWTNMVRGEDAPSLEGLNFSLINETQQIEETGTEV